MPKFSNKSTSKLYTCEIRLRQLFMSVIDDFDCTVIWGHRNAYWQNLFYEQGTSKLKFPDGKHNKTPSEAIDVVPYIPGIGIVWEAHQCYFFAGFVMDRAIQKGIPIRLGADWDGDNDVNDQTFIDICHFELI